jgi:hypothetical protein
VVFVRFLLFERSTHIDAATRHNIGSVRGNLAACAVSDSLPTLSKNSPSNPGESGERAREEWIEASHGKLRPDKARSRPAKWCGFSFPSGSVVSA